MFKRIASYGALIFTGSMLNVVSRTIDVIFLASQSSGGLSDANVFSYGSYMISIMDVPQRSIIAIATPIISQAWKDKNKGQIHEIYQKTSLNLLVVGFFIFGIIFLNLHNAIEYLGKEYAPMQWIFVVMGIAKLIDLGTGSNSQILLLSKYWRLDFITNMLFVALALFLLYLEAVWLTAIYKKYMVYHPYCSALHWHCTFCAAHAQPVFRRCSTVRNLRVVVCNSRVVLPCIGRSHRTFSTYITTV
jgi:O-antigen/teichoic acid export membrane protein